DVAKTPMRRRRAVESASPAYRPADAAQAANDAWRELIDAGSKILAQLVATAQASTAGKPAAPEHPFVQTDPESGRLYLRLPMPDSDTLAKLAGALAGLLPRSSSPTNKSGMNST
ncbi:MAG: hypothetical protein ACXWUH_15215, partial [Burkholderiales bacterium]